MQKFTIKITYKSGSAAKAEFDTEEAANKYGGDISFDDDMRDRKQFRKVELVENLPEGEKFIRTF